MFALCAMNSAAYCRFSARECRLSVLFACIRDPDYISLGEQAKKCIWDVLEPGGPALSASGLCRNNRVGRALNIGRVRIHNRQKKPHEKLKNCPVPFNYTYV